MKIWYVAIIVCLTHVSAQGQFRAVRPDVSPSVQLATCSDAALLARLKQLICSLNVNLADCCSFLTSQIDAIETDIENRLGSVIDTFGNLTAVDQVIQNIILVLSIIENIDDGVVASLVGVIESSESAFDQIISHIDTDIQIDQTILSYVDTIDTQLDKAQSLLEQLVDQDCQSVHEIMLSDIDAIASDMDNALLLADQIMRAKETIASQVDMLDTQFDAIQSVVDLLAADACASSSDNIASRLSALQEQEASCCADLSLQIDDIRTDADTRLDTIQNILNIVSNFSLDGSRVSAIISVIEFIENNGPELFVESSFEQISSQIESLQGCATIALSAPGTINAPGNYCLTQNIAGNITIAVSNVLLDLNGFTIIGTAVPNDAAVYVNADVQNIMIINGDIDATAARFGIVVNVGVHDITVSDITIKNAQDFGVIADGTIRPIVGLLLSDLVVRDGSDGFFLQACQGQCVDCTALANSGTGFTIMAPYFCLTLQNTQSRNNGLQGYLMQDITPASTSTVFAYNCAAYANGQAGFSLVGSNIGIYNCISSNNTGNGFYINTTDCTGLISGSSAIANIAGGFVTDALTTAVKFSGNYSSDNKLLGTNIALPVNYGYSNTNVYGQNSSPFWWLYWNSTMASKWSSTNGSNPT